MNENHATDLDVAFNKALAEHPIPPQKERIGQPADTDKRKRKPKQRAVIRSGRGPKRS